MKVTFDKFSDDYLGNYLQEYKNVGLFVESSLELRERLNKGEIYKIKKNTCFDLFIYNEIANIDPTNICSIYFEKIDKFLSGRHRYINKSDYDKILEIICQPSKVDDKKDLYYHINSNEDSDKISHLKQYVNDFALMVIYAKTHCFKAKEEHEKKLEILFGGEDGQKDIENLYARIAVGNVDIENITIKYQNIPRKRKRRKTKEVEDISLTIKSPLLIKIMLYEFAKKYYSGILKGNSEDWENNILGDFQDGRDYNVDKANKIALINSYMGFIEHIDLFRKNTPKIYKHLLLGRLLAIVGLDKYDALYSPYPNERQHYTNTLSKILRPSQVKKI